MFNSLLKICFFFFFLRYDTSFQDACVSLLNRWEQWDGIGEPFKKCDLEGFQTPQIIQFLALVLKSDGFTLQKIISMQKIYNFNNNGNCEILLRLLKYLHYNQGQIKGRV